MASRNRIIYASQSVVVGGEFLYRVQTLGSTTTFNSTDLFELGQQDIVDVVDDVPTVAVTLDTNEWGSALTAASLGNVDTSNWGVTANASNANLVTVSGTTNINYYHGVSLSHYGTTGSEFDLWAAVQTEASLGTATDNIDQTMFMARCFVNGITLNYAVGGEATENYTAETDNKTWYLNSSRFVSQEEWTTISGSAYNLGLADGTNVVATLSDNTRAFLYTDPTDGKRSVNILRADGTETFVAINDGAASATEAGYDSSTNVVTLPSSVSVGPADTVRIRYAADAYANATDGDSDVQKANYFTAATDANTSGEHSNLGGVRQGQVEIYLVDPDVTTDYSLALRLQSVNISAALNRDALSQLGNLKPYDRPLTFPVELTTSVETTAGDLETFASFSGRDADFTSGSMLDLTIDHLLQKDNLVLVVMVYDQTDVEAGGTGADRLALRADLAGKSYWNAGVAGTYPDPIVPGTAVREYPLKTIVIPALKSTNENYQLAVGSNATQSFTFRSVNRLFTVKGYAPVNDMLLTPGFQKV